MSAVVCGKRSSIFEESSSSSPPVSKRIRCSSSSPVPPPTANSSSPLGSSLDLLLAIFPGMDKEFLERTLEECGDDLDYAVRSLNELRLGSAENLLSPDERPAEEAEGQNQNQGTAANNCDSAPAHNSSVGSTLPLDGAEWVELFVKEMSSASDINDAKARASRALEALEKSISARVTADAAQVFQQENVILKQQIEALLQENSILKRAVSIQHERHKEFDDRGLEVQQLKQVVAQYQEQLRTLEVNNYALTMHLKQAQQGNSIPGRYHPDVF
ncbi:hypothetical protein Leryth_007936 [Lithospermum erythrorhizon]|nr:hypothetical protein Leryth_007936 [Lithospermum erythrorhizon]